MMLVFPAPHAPTGGCLTAQGRADKSSRLTSKHLAAAAGTAAAGLSTGSQGGCDAQGDQHCADVSPPVCTTGAGPARLQKLHAGKLASTAACMWFALPTAGAHAGHRQSTPPTFVRLHACLQEANTGQAARLDDAAALLQDKDRLEETVKKQHALIEQRGQELKVMKAQLEGKEAALEKAR